MFPENDTTAKAICWVAGSPEKKLQGTLRFGPTSGAEVDLFGQFYDSLDSKRLNERFTLHCHTFQNRFVTLFNCIVTGGQINLPGGRSSKIRSVVGVAGGHYASLEEVKFQKVEVWLKWLKEWTITTGISLNPQEDGRSAQIGYSLPKPIQLGQVGPFLFEIEFRGRIQPAFHNLEITEDCVLILTSEQPEPYTEFEERIEAFQRFLCFAVQRPVHPKSITGFLKTQESSKDSGFQEFLVIRTIDPADSDKDGLRPDEQLFCLPELGESPGAIFLKFMERHEMLRASMELYFSTVYRESRTPRVQFLTLAQALEAYHRAGFGGKYMDDESYETGLRAKLSECIAALPGIERDFRVSLRNKLRYLHEFSLRRRLKLLAARYDDILQSLIGDADEFSTRVSELRNRLTHLDSEGVDAGRDYNNILNLSEKMALLFETCLLGEIGFEKAQIAEIIANRNKRTQRLEKGWI